MNLRLLLCLPPVSLFLAGAAVPAASAQGAKPAEGETAGTAAAEEEGPQVPEDLLEDEHVREEYGVNPFTTPSIRKIFGQLDGLGTLPYEKLRRSLPDKVPSDRSLVALSLGTLIGDGFLSVQTEKVSDLEDVGRAVLKFARSLGAGDRVTSHAKSLLENSAAGDWKMLREDLAGTQRDVEREMVLLRDMEMAHLISLGGWLRGLEIVSGSALEPFSPERAALLARTDLVEYFHAILGDLDPSLQKRPHIRDLRAGVQELLELISMPPGKPFETEQVEKIHAKARALVDLVSPTRKPQ